MKLPQVWTEGFKDSLYKRLSEEAATLFRVHGLPDNKAEWERLRSRLREQIWRSMGSRPDHDLPLKMKEYGRIQCDGYTLRNIVYQSRPGFYVTGSLFVPDGEGPFPAVVGVHGHWSQGRLSIRVQERGHSLAKNGYVCLNVDAFGSGERCLVHGEYEYHGGNMGASLMNVGETLMGMQVVDNMRAVDLLCELDLVDPQRIGATGASGGGNQTMWLAAMDDRIAASVPVVSVGTFESYVGRSNCICELLPDGLTFTEEAGVLALAAPNAMKICNCLQDSNPTFYPSEMLRSYREARRVFQALDVDSKLAYQVFDMPHGYWPEIREAMIGWFDLHLKGIGTGAPRVEKPFNVLEESQLMVFAPGERIAEVQSIPDFCIAKGEELHREYMAREGFDAAEERNKLRDILRIGDPLEMQQVVNYGTESGWEKMAVQTKCDRLIPLLIRRPADGSGRYVILGHPQGKGKLAESDLLKNLPDDRGVVLADFWGHGERCEADSPPDGYTYRLLSRGALWLGKSVMGEWAREWSLLHVFTHVQLEATAVEAGGVAEVGLAALFCSALGTEFKTVSLEKGPLSYRYAGKGVPGDCFSMATHLPGFLCWGDVSLAAALTEAEVRFVPAVRMDGSEADEGEMAAWQAELAGVKKRISRR